MIDQGGDHDRTMKILRSRFGVISTIVSKFQGILVQIDNNPVSGQNSDDAEQAAFETYKMTHPKSLAFEFKECWNVLRQLQKWGDVRQGSGGSLDVSPGSDSNSPTNHGSVESSERDNVQNATIARPWGIKRAKVALAYSKVSMLQVKSIQRANGLPEKRLKAEVMEDIRNRQTTTNGRDTSLHQNIAQPSASCPLENQVVDGKMFDLND